MMRKTTFQFRIDPELKDKLARLARQDQRSQSQMVEIAVQQFIQREWDTPKRRITMLTD